MSDIQRIKETRQRLLAQLHQNGRPIYAPDIHRQKVNEIEQAYQTSLNEIMGAAEERYHAASDKLKAYQNPFAAFQHLSNDDLHRAGLLLPFIKAEFASVGTNQAANELLRAALATDDKALGFVAWQAANEAHQAAGFHPYETTLFNQLTQQLETAVLPAEWLSKRESLQTAVAEAEAVYKQAEGHTSAYKTAVAANLGVNAALLPDPL